MKSGLVAGAPITTIAPISSTTIPTTTTAATTAWGTIFTRTGNVDGQRTALEFLAVEHFNGLVGFISTAHFDKGKAARLARELVHHDVHRANDTSLGEEILKVSVYGLVGEISYEEA